ncbi:MAG: cytochrome C oxidase subunit IV family protein [Chitinophagaceae bacterium]
MEQHNSLSEVTFHHEPAQDSVKRIIRTTIVLSVITIIELALGFWIYEIHKGAHPSASLVLGIKGVIIILSLAKAFYIVSIFMHLGDEIRNLIMTIVVPLLLFVWFIIAFLADGNSWKNLRNEYKPKDAVKHEQAPHSGGGH